MTEITGMTDNTGMTEGAVTEGAVTESRHGRP